MTGDVWPALPLAEWSDTYATLHMWTQIVGKTRLALAPMENHWWQVALYITPRGLTTSAMPFGTRTLAVDFDFLDHQLYLRTSEGATRSIPLVAQSVADFYAAYRAALGALEVDAHIMLRPVEVVTVRLRARGGRVALPPDPPPRRRRRRGGTARTVVFDGRARRAAVHRRDDLAPGRRVPGPAIVCEYSATTVVPPGWRLTVDRLGGLVLEATGS